MKAKKLTFTLTLSYKEVGACCQWLVGQEFDMKSKLLSNAGPDFVQTLAITRSVLFLSNKIGQCLSSVK